MTRFGFLWALAMIGPACTTLPPEAAQSAGVDSIRFETGPCFGTCPVYTVTVGADGNGTFLGRRFTAVAGERRFRVSPDEYRAFVRHLAPLRPRQGEVRYSGEACEMMATDLPSAEVTWSEDSDRQTLYFNYGCDMERNRAIAERLNRAPNLLPLGALVGRRN